MGTFLFMWPSMFSEMPCSVSAVDTWIGFGDVRSIGHGLEEMSCANLCRTLHVGVPSHQYKHVVFLVGSHSHQREPSLALSLVDIDNARREGNLT